MNEIKAKDCFGEYEDVTCSCSWHCRGCIFAEECKEHQLKQREAQNGKTE